jgi:hypothetical protein
MIIHPPRPFYSEGEPINWHRGYLNQCYEIARFATCVKAKVGAQVRCPRGMLLGEGWNHSPNPNCDDCANLCAGGIRKDVKSGTRLELCHAVHAEQWAIHKAGEKAKGATLYVASFHANGDKRLKDASLPLGHPMHGFYCSMCARACWMAGIVRIFTDGIDDTIVEYTPEEIWETSYGVAGSI